MPERRGFLLGILALAAVVAFLFREVLWGRVLFWGDIQYVWMPKADAFRRVVAAGSWPLWNPYSASGAPMLGTPTTQVLYAPTWLLLVMRPWTYYSAYVIAHVLVWGVGVVRLSRRLGATTAGSVMAGLVAVACGPILSIVYIWNHLAGVAWIPWSVLAGDRALESGHRRWVLGWGALQALILVAGYPEAVAMAAVTTVVLAARHGRPTGARLRRQAGVALLAALFAVGLSAGLWMPALEQARGSARAEPGMVDLDKWSMHPLGLAEAVVPVRPTDLPLRTEHRRALYTEPAHPLLRSIYLGLVACVLVAGAAASARRREVLLLVGLIALAYLVTLGTRTPLHALAVRAIPPLGSFRHPVKAVVVIALAWCVLAGLGYDAWTRGVALWSRRARRATLGLLLAAGSLALVLFAGCRFAPARVAQLAFVPEAWEDNALVVEVGNGVGLALLAALAATAVLLALNRLQGGLRTAVVGGLVTADLALAASGLLPTAPADFFEMKPALLEQMRGPAGSRLYVCDYWVPGMGQRFLGHEGYRAASPRSLWSVHAALRQYVQTAQQATWGLEVAYESDEFNFQPSYVDALTRVVWWAQGNQPYLHRLLQLAAVSRVVSLHDQGFEGLPLLAHADGILEEAIRVRAVPDAVPRAYAVSGVRVAQGHEGIVQALMAMDPAREVLLTEEREGRPVDPTFHSRVTAKAWQPDDIVLEAELSSPGHVVLVDSFDPGWRTTVDGVATRLLRANVSFRAIPVPAGRHEVRLVYRPSTVTTGLAISALSLLVTLAVALWQPRAAVAASPSEAAC